MSTDLERAVAAAVDDLDRQVSDRKYLRAERYRARYASDPEYRQREQERKRDQGRRAHQKKGTAERLYQSAYHRAKRQGVPFNLTVGYLRQLWPVSGKCPVLGFRMILDAPEADLWPSLDRFNHDAGYVEGNVRIISNRANRLKNDASPSELARVLAYTDSADPASYEFEHGDMSVRVLRKV